MSAKAELRATLLARRDAESDRPAKSRAIGTRVLELQECRAARVVASYVGVKNEVATSDLLDRLLLEGKTVAVPWRDGDDLEFTVITGLRELAPASFGLYEPPEAIRALPRRRLIPESIDLLLIPGVGFDRSGGRLGQGRAYYDRFLRRCGPGAARVGLAFECQVVDRIPMGPGDERVDVVVTERSVYRVSEPGASASR